MTIAPTASTSASTIARLGRYRWDAAPRLSPYNPARFPRLGVVGEVKPHHGAGIAAGINQLRTRARGGKTPQLVTYRQVPGRPTSYDVLAADSDQLKVLLAGLRGPRGVTAAGVRTLTTWYWLGRVAVPEAVVPIPVWQCATTFGSVIEPYIRAQYAAKVGARLGSKDAQQTGADISHERELAAFLRELAAELEAEAGGAY